MNSGKDIMRDLIASQQTNCVLKIKLRNAQNPVITAVEQIGRKKIVLKPTCLYGYKLRKRNITLPEIESVVRFKTRFDSPLFARLRYIRSNISSLRHTLDQMNEPAIQGLQTR
jgi:hypothetical protein